MFINPDLDYTGNVAQASGSKFEPDMERRWLPGYETSLFVRLLSDICHPILGILLASADTLSQNDRACSHDHMWNVLPTVLHPLQHIGEDVLLMYLHFNRVNLMLYH